MKLPQQILRSHLFQFDAIKELLQALGDHVSEEEIIEIKRLSELKLPPIVSENVLSTLIGVNPGILWSFSNRSSNHYRIFPLKTGKKTREITAPRVGLKVVQTWLAYHWQQCFKSMPHVHGFVSGKSHVTAAKEHIGAKWVSSFDLEDFFPNTPQNLVKQSFEKLGYNDKSANFLCELTCLNGALPQGAPTSPVLSNMCFLDFDEKLVLLAAEQNLTFTRYADDLSFSGSNEFDEKLTEKVESKFLGSPWKLSETKRKFSQAPARLKIHGLLLKDNEVRLTKGYRNRIRAFRHIISNKQLENQDYRRLMGHLNYSKYIDANGSK